MGLFFDQDWFDERLRAAGLTRASIAHAAGMSIDEVDMVFRDQRELEGPEVHAIARMFGADPREIANRSGIANPGPADAIPPPRPSLRSVSAEPEFVVTREVIQGIHERLDRLERLLELVVQKIDRR